MTIARGQIFARLSGLHIESVAGQRLSRGTNHALFSRAKTLVGRAWVGLKQSDGSRTIVPRQEEAQIFKSRNEAQRAIDGMPKILKVAGFQFTITPVEKASQIDIAAARKPAKKLSNSRRHPAVPQEGPPNPGNESTK